MYSEMKPIQIEKYFKICILNVFIPQKLYVSMQELHVSKPIWIQSSPVCLHPLYEATLAHFYPILSNFKSCHFWQNWKRIAMTILLNSAKCIGSKSEQKCNDFGPMCDTAEARLPSSSWKKNQRKIPCSVSFLERYMQNHFSWLPSCHACFWP